jgi:hypothetical protein
MVHEWQIGSDLEESGRGLSLTIQEFAGRDWRNQRKKLVTMACIRARPSKVVFLKRRAVL